jgi:hypothetical protein
MIVLPTQLKAGDKVTVKGFTPGMDDFEKDFVVKAAHEEYVQFTSGHHYRTGAITTLYTKRYIKRAIDCWMERA